MYELVYTSAPRGLIAGRSGFSTVAITAGFPPNLISPIENMSGYRNLFPPGDPDADRNPVNYSCQHFRWGGTLFIVLSKVSYAGLSFTGRTNVLAHHLLFTPAELAAIPGGATAVLRCPENFPPWSGDPRELPQKSLKRIGRAPAASPELWAELAGDRNWAACIADRFRTDPKSGWVCAFDPLKYSGETVLDLIDPVTHCLSPEEALDYTFCTYCTSSAVNNSFALRAYTDGSPQLANAEYSMPESVIRLGRRQKVPAWWQPPKPPEPPAPPEPVASPADPLPPTAGGTTEHAEAPERSAPAPVRLTIPLRPPRVKACAPGGAVPPPRPPQQEIPVQETPPPERRSPFPGIIFAAAVLFLGSVLLFFLFRPSSGKAGTRPPVPSAGETAPRKIPPRKAEGSAQAVPASAVPSASPRKTPPRRTAQRPAGRPIPRPESAKELLRRRFLFHREFNLGRKAPLPPAFRNASALTVTLGGIGSSNEIDDIRSYVSGNGRKIIVHPFKETRSELLMTQSRDDRSQHVMILELKDGCLSVKVPEPARNRPRIENIIKITVTAPDGKLFDFIPGVPDRDFIRFIRDNPGTLRIRQTKEGEAAYDCSLEISDDLRAFWRHLVLRINGKTIRGDADSRFVEAPGPDFTEAQRFLRQWNKAVKNFAEACEELDQRSPEEEAFGKELKQLLTLVPEGGKAQKEGLRKAVKLRKTSISDEIAALCAKLPPPQEKKKGKSVSPPEPPLKKRFEEFGKKWNEFRKSQENLRKHYTDIYEQIRGETVRQLQALPRELFGKCREEVEAGKRVPADFYKRFPPNWPKHIIKIETDWREDHGSASHDR